jgi:hypothetical protein
MFRVFDGFSEQSRQRGTPLITISSEGIGARPCAAVNTPSASAPRRGSSSSSFH